METINYALTAAGSLGADFSSSVIPLGDVEHLAIQAVWTGTPTGNFKVQASCDDGGNAAGASVTNWIDVPSSTQAGGGAAGSYLWNLSGLGYRWARLVYVRTSGTGSVAVRVNAKGY